MEGPGIGTGDSHRAAQGRSGQLPGGLEAQGTHFGRGKKEVRAANNVTRNTNSPQRGAETLRLVKTRLSGFCPALEQDGRVWGGRCGRPVSVGRGLGTGPDGFPGRTRVQWVVSQDAGSETAACTSGARHPASGREPHVPVSPRAAPRSGQAVQVRWSTMTWKGSLEACIKIDKTHFQGSGDLTFSLV